MFRGGPLQVAFALAYQELRTNESTANKTKILYNLFDPMKLLRNGSYW